MKKAKKIILIRVDGHKRIGMGHVYRMLTLANYLRKENDFAFIFVNRNCAASVNLIKRSGFPFVTVPFGIKLSQEIKQLINILRFYRPSMIIFDVLHSDADRAFIECLRYDDNVLLTTFNDDAKQKFINADIIFLSDFLQRPDSYSTQEAKYYVGFNYLILNEEYARLNKIARKTNKAVNRVVVCMGGADQHNLTAKVLRAIDNSPIHFKCQVVVNSSFFNRDLARRLSSNLAHDVSFSFDVDNLAGHFSLADMAITSGGLVHLERMSSGIPGIVINQHLRQADLSSRLMKEEATVDLGLHNHVSEGKIVKAFNDLAKSYAQRLNMSNKGKGLVDGKGLFRIAEIITQALDTESKR